MSTLFDTVDHLSFMEAVVCVTDPSGFLLVASNHILQSFPLILQSFTDILRSPRSPKGLVLSRWKVGVPSDKLVLPESLGFAVSKTM